MRFTIVTVVCLSGSIAAADTNFAASANGGVAAQVSNWSAVSTADKANDGDRNGDYFGPNSIAHTGNSTQAWWRCDFAELSNIGQVIVFNRTDGWEDRINTFTIELFAGGDVVWSSSGNTFVADIEGPEIAGMIFELGGIDADAVGVHLDGTNYLQLAEVEAWASRRPARSRS